MPDTNCSERGAITLDRYCGQSIDIGTDVRVTLVKSGRNRAKLRVEAPKSIRISRPEPPRRTDAQP